MGGEEDQAEGAEEGERGGEEEETVVAVVIPIYLRARVERTSINVAYDALKSCISARTSSKPFQWLYIKLSRGPRRPDEPAGYMTLKTSSYLFIV